VVSVLAVGDTFTAAVENDIAKQLNEMHAYMVLTNPNVSTPGSGTATWVTMGNVTVPTWATRARVCLSITGARGNTAAGNVNLAVKIGSSTGAAKLVGWSDITTRYAYPINDLLTSVPTGSQSVTVQATFSSNTLLAASTFCSFDLNIDWMQ